MPRFSAPITTLAGLILIGLVAAGCAGASTPAAASPAAAAADQVAAKVPTLDDDHHRRPRGRLVRLRSRRRR